MSSVSSSTLPAAIIERTPCKFLAISPVDAVRRTTASSRADQARAQQPFRDGARTGYVEADDDEDRERREEQDIEERACGDFADRRLLLEIERVGHDQPQRSGKGRQLAGPAKEEHDETTPPR